MLNDITLGQYYPGNSLIHRLDARVKIILLFFYVVFLFLFDHNLCYALNTLGAVAIICLSKLPPVLILRSIKPLWWILLFTFIIQLCTIPGEVFFSLGFISCTYEGLVRGFVISWRLVLLLGVSALLMYTTSPLMLTDGLEALFRPLKKIGFPAHELAMMMTIALRFIPTLLEETDKIIKAQQSRGSDIGRGNIFQKAKAMIPILVPLFISAFRRADELAMAMEARGYHGGEGRTRMKAMRFHKEDVVAGAVSAIFFLGLIGIYLFDRF